MANYLDMRDRMAEITAATPEIIKKWNKGLRAVLVSAPPTAINNASGNYALIKGAGEVRHLSVSLPGYADWIGQAKRFRKEEGVPSARVREITEQTDLWAEGHGIIPDEARTVGAGFGVENRAEKLKQIPGKAYDAYATWRRAPEATSSTSCGRRDIPSKSRRGSSAR